MRIVPVNLWNQPPSTQSPDPLLGRSKGVLPEILAQRGIRLRGQRNHVYHFLEEIISSCRVLIAEGISGSGKDTFQNYLKESLQRRGRDVYDYSEGEVLHSWKQLQIDGILNLRVQFMKLFVDHMRDVVRRDRNAVFLLNRFHLSTYASTIVQQPNLQGQYNQVINVLRMLPIHVFILQLDDDEIEQRSFHPERSGAWRKFQQQIVDKHSFRNRLQQQQKLILEAAKSQQIAYSVIRLLSEPSIGNGQIRLSTAPRIAHRAARLNRANTKMTESKTSDPPILLKS
jgi:thymidylate kinase